MIFGVSRRIFSVVATPDGAPGRGIQPVPRRRGHSRRMNRPDEERQIADVVERLEEKFPSLSTQEIEVIVAEQVALLDGNPIRDYIPRLVEHGAKEKLRAASSG